MSNQEARAQFDAAIANTTDANQIAHLELAREYFTNPAFRAELEETTWNLNEGGAR